MDTFDTIICILDTDLGVTSDIFVESCVFVLSKMGLCRDVKFDNGYFGPRSPDIVKALTSLYNAGYTAESMAGPTTYSYYESRLTTRGKEYANSLKDKENYNEIQEITNTMLKYQEGYSIQYVVKAFYQNESNIRKFCKSLAWDKREPPIDNAETLFDILRSRLPIVV